MTRELRGSLEGAGLAIGVVVSRFNEFITSRLLAGAREALSRHGVRDEDVTIVHVPGSFEIPLVARTMAASGRYNAVVCLGAVVRGETDHYDHVAAQAANGIARVSAETGVPIVFGVLTTDTVELALDRAGGKHGNNGDRAVATAIEMANLLRDLSLSGG